MITRAEGECLECGEYGLLESKRHGLCRRCYGRNYRRGTLVPPPRRRLRNPKVRQAFEDRLTALYGVNFVSVLPSK